MTEATAGRLEAVANAVPDTVSALLRRHARLRPADAAIVAPQTPTLDYSALFRRTSAIAEHLRRLGIGRDDRVAVSLPNGPDAAVAVLGVMSAATCAPLNPSYGDGEFSFYLRDLGARAVLTDAGSPALHAAVAALGLPMIDIATIGAGHGRRPAASATGAPDAAALVLHTSGTTARPKQVVLSHRNLLASAHHVATALRLGEHDRCLNVMPLFHIHGLVAALLASLAAGGSVVCAPGFREDGFFDWLGRLRPTWYTAVPTIHQSILAHAEAHSDAIRRNPLRLVRSSSAALPPQVMAALERTFDCPVIEAYGMTEAAHQMTSNPLPPGLRKPGSAGIAAGPEVAIMGEGGQLLGPRTTGEVVIRGPNVTAGYAGNPQATAAAFTGGWFRTGDEGYLDEDGYLFLTGRLKEIINRGGEKVSPREVDEALLDHPKVAQAVAFAVQHATLGEDVVAAVVLRAGASLAEGEIRASLFGRLAEFKIPSRVVIVDAIPKGPTGKVQRIGLAERLADQLGTGYRAPADAIEQVVALLFGELLGVDRVGAADNFFSLGGDSLRAMQLLSRVLALFPVDLSQAVLFRKPTVAEFAQAIAEALPPEAQGGLAELLVAITGMSDEQARSALHEGIAQGGHITRMT